MIPHMIEYPLKVLIIDDDQDIINIISAFLKLNPKYEVFTFTNPKEAIESAKTINYSIALIDINMPELTGDMVLKELHNLKKGMQLIIMTASYELTTFHAAFRSRANSFVFKPISKQKLEGALDRAREVIDMWNGQFEKLIEHKRANKK